MGLTSKRFVVLGANGYLGSHLASSMIAAGHQVSAYDLSGPNPNLSFPVRSLDVSNPALWQAVDTDVDAIFYFSGMSGTRRSFDQYANYMAANELGLLHLLDLLRRRGNKPRVVFPSSRLVYRGRTTPLDESSPQESKTVYAANKIAGEAFLQAYWNAYGIPFVVYRICVPYGNLLGGPFSYGTIGSFVEVARNRKIITLYGDGSLRRTFTHVEDICGQIAATTLLPESEGAVFNVAGEALSLFQVAESVATRMGATIAFSTWPESEWTIESGDTVFDAAKILALLPHPPRHCFREWIAPAVLPGAPM